MRSSRQRCGCICVAAAIAVAGCAQPSAPNDDGERPASIRFLAEGAPTGFARASEPRQFAFPRDHASHPEFRTEWWYFTGNLHAADNRHFGFELTFFRIALAAEQATRESAWATNQVWMAHLAVTDSSERRFVARERFARGALGLAGATAEPLRVWTGQWSVTGPASGGDAELTLRAHDQDLMLDLALTPLKPPVLHGDRGLDAKGPEPGNASFYYSLPRLQARGTLAIGEQRHAVEGLAWMDREWGTSALSPGVAGWDWFALHLSDGRDLMFYRLRRTDGSASEFSGGSLIDASGERRALAADDVELAVERRWTSPRSGVTYPVAWRLAMPTERIELAIVPHLDDQELELSVRYWEGAVHASGTSAGAVLTADGYLELAGY